MYTWDSLCLDLFFNQFTLHNQISKYSKIS